MVWFTQVWVGEEREKNYSSVWLKYSHFLSFFILDQREEKWMGKRTEIGREREKEERKEMEWWKRGRKKHCFEFNVMQVQQVEVLSHFIPSFLLDMMLCSGRIGFDLQTTFSSLSLSLSSLSFPPNGRKK